MRFLRWALVALAIARIAAAAAPASPWWGLDALGYVDLGLAVALWLMPAMLLVPAVSDRFDTMLRAVADLTRNTTIPWTVIACAGAAALALLLPDRTWFIGDFILRQGSVVLGSDAPSLPQVLPLDDFLHVRLPQLLGAGRLESVNLFARVLGAIDSAMLAALALQWARLQGGAPHHRAILAAIVYCGGFLTVMTGFGKSAGEQCVVTLAAAFLGMRALKEGGSLLVLGAVTALGLLLHRSGILLLPAVVFAGRRVMRGRRFGPGDIAGGVLVFVALAVIGPRLVDILVTFDLPRYSTAPGERAPRWLASALDPRHWREVLNLLLVLSPVGLLSFLRVMTPAPAGRRAEWAFIALVIAPQIAVMLAGPPAQGLFRDWDVFAPAGVTFSLAAAWELGLALDSPAWSRTALPAAAAAASCALAWMFHFADIGRGMARVETHARRSTSLGDVARASAWEFLGFRYRLLGDPVKAAATHAEVVKLKPSRYLYVSWALAEYEAGNPAGARAAFDSLTRRHPKYPLGWYGFAAASAWLQDSVGEARGLAGVRRTLKRQDQAEEIRRFVETYPFVAPDSNHGRESSPR